MWNVNDDLAARGGRPRPAFPVRAAVPLLVLLLAAFAAPVPLAAQEAETGTAAAPVTPAAETPAEAPVVPAPETPAETPAVEAAPGAAGEADELASHLAATYRARYTADGVELLPRGRVAPGVSVVEVADGEVLVNGEEVSETTLRAWFGAEAAPLLALAERDADEARRLLSVDEPVADEATDAAAAALPEPPRPPEPPEADAPDPRRKRSGSILKFGSDVVIDSDEVADEAVSIGGAVIVHGEVRRDVVAIGGDVEVHGEVGGELTAVFGDVDLGPESRVDGNVLSVGGRVRRAPGAEVTGDIEQIGVSGIDSGEIDWDGWVRRDASGPIRHWKIDDAYWNLVRAALLALLACLTYLVGRRSVDAVAGRFASLLEVVIAFAVGVAAWLLIVPVTVILVVLVAITIVGCLLLPLVLVAEAALVVVVFLIGYTAVALRVGSWIGRRFGRRFGGYLLIVVGVLAIEIWHLLGQGLDIFAGPMAFFAWMFIVVGIAVEFLATTIGIGGVILHFFDSRRQAGELPPGPPPAGSLPPGAGDDTAPTAEPLPEPSPETPPEPTPEQTPEPGPPGEPFFDDPGNESGDDPGDGEAGDGDDDGEGKPAG